MTVKLELKLSVFFAVLLFSLIIQKTDAQGGINGWIKKQGDNVNKKVDQVFNGKNNSSTLQQDNSKSQNNEQTTGRPVLSELKDEDFIQNKQNPSKDNADTRYMIARNFFIDIAGKYPNGYMPKWRFINYASPLSFSRENWIFPNANLGQEARQVSLVEYGGLLTLRLDAGCQCFADIVVKDSFTVLTQNPQVFEIRNFRKILNERSTGEPCVGIANWTTNGGWAGKISLSANRNGDIGMDLMLENYSLEGNHGGKFKPSQVSYRYTAKNITVENEMSAQKAAAIVVAEQEAKQRQKDYITKTTKQADSLQKTIAKKYPQSDCRDCFARNSNSNLKITPTKTAYTNGYGDVYVESGTDWDINTKTEIQNKCNYDLIFVGIQQLYDEVKGYYLVEVTKTMEKGYKFSSDQGAMASIFSSLVGGGSEFNIKVQDKYYPGYATVGAVQWLKVIKSK